MNKTMIRVCLCSLLLLTIVVGEAIAGGQKVNLIPEEGFFGIRAQIASYYYAAVTEKLLSSNPIVRRCQAVFLPSFSPESAVYLVWDDDKPNDAPVVVSIELERSLYSELQQLIQEEAPDKRAYSTGLEAQLKVLPKLQLKAIRKEAPIEHETARIIDRLWRKAISQARFPEQFPQILDGEHVHFSSLGNGGYHTAEAWSPSKGTPAYGLVEIARKLQMYPHLKESERKGASISLSKMARRLLARVESTP